MYKISKLMALALVLSLGWPACNTPLSDSEGTEELALRFPNVLDLEGVPDSAFDRRPSAFSDHGAWFAYALPDENHVDKIGSFVGPYLFTQDNGVWSSKFLSQLEIWDLESGEALDLTKAESLVINAYPGKLHQSFLLPDYGISVFTDLIFVSDQTARIRLELSAEISKRYECRWKGRSLMAGLQFEKVDTGILLRFADNGHIGGIMVRDNEDAQIEVKPEQYQIRVPLDLQAGESAMVHLYHTFCFENTDWAWEMVRLQKPENSTKEEDLLHRNRWNTWLSAVLDDIEPSYDNEEDQRIAVKTLQTLTTNWRGAAGFLKHQGLFPSYHYQWFHGFWAWDSWKHAVSLARFAPDLAQDQVRAMFDFQDDAGMIADCVYRDTIIENHNWRNTKPPLAAWAIWESYERSGSHAFLQEMFPKAKKYHAWWYQYRDLDQNGLCEYGSTDGTLIAAKWDSGMDNAVRFDDTKLLKSPNEAGAWSMNRESVDLNAFLYLDKLYLAKIASVLSKTEEQQRYETEAKNLKQKIQTQFYSAKTGWFHDIDLESKAPILHYGAEGWIPLWTGAASDKQAASARDKMVDTSKFATYIPFPTLAADEEGFEPVESYWRGPVWLDQAYFAINGLKKYGYNEDANRFTHHLLDRLQGLKNSGAAIRENYNPLSGEGYESHHFSWSAAHLLLLLTEEEGGGRQNQNGNQNSN